MTDFRVCVVVRHDPNSSDPVEPVSAHGRYELAAAAIERHVQRELDDIDTEYIDENPGAMVGEWAANFKAEFEKNRKILPHQHVLRNIDLEDPANLLLAATDVYFEVYEHVPLELEVLDGR